MKLKTITDKSWIVLSDDNERIGMLNEGKEQFTLLMKSVKYEFKSKEELNIHFNKDIFRHIIEPVFQQRNIEKFIKGLPVDYDSPIEVEIEGNSLPLFVKKEGSKIYFSAGYYCLEYPKGWMPSLNPKLSTLELYNHKGPFVDELQMRTALQTERKKNA